ncbi:hypothetical protein EDI_034480 [Entamoeba dispar SAW760]|uniref:TLDc domain-containing protein n=1 Tax=Entamoeba dispar (strain ATCC PRA-260 / SAW760) TaxID=370354 RepID=B0EJN0_ENTDS|nr:uncharacterized protein EDI_034480 [Entamoeba dispar SAW760]EDR25275.1 hypothetical protein EDI_034480 [Entamoeba dispar SAW760]|eukprot:EDR25275.1 hypothetical protein EDI_034480 [Entamoeba dispar SAW760]
MDVSQFNGKIYIQNNGTIHLYNNSDRKLTEEGNGKKVEIFDKKKEVFVEKKTFEKTVSILKESIKNIETSLKELKNLVDRRCVKVDKNEKGKELNEENPLFLSQSTTYNSIQTDVKLLKKKIDILQKKSDIDKIKVRDYSMVDYISYLKQWTNKSHFKIIYDSSIDELSLRGLNSKIKGLTDVLLLVETDNNDLFGSFTATRVPIVRHEEHTTFFGKDPGFFVFTLRNPHNIQPIKFIKKDCYKTMMFWNQPNELDAVISAILCFRISDGGKSMIMNQFKDFYDDPTGLGDDVFTGSHEPSCFGLSRLLAIKCN